MSHVPSPSSSTAVLAGLLVLLLAALSSAGTALADDGTGRFERIERIAADTPLRESIAWSQLSFPDGTAPEAVVADADGGDRVLAGQLLADRPLLLPSDGRIDAMLLAELERLGTRTVHLLGGTAAISEHEARRLQFEGYTVIRHAGTDRYTTAVAVASSRPVGDRIVLTGDGPDTLTAGAAAAYADLPLLLTGRDRLHPAVIDWVAAHPQVQQVLVIGGESALDDRIDDDLRSLGLAVTRVAGSTRHHTAVAVAVALGMPDSTAAPVSVLVNAETDQAALPAAAALAGRLRAALITTGETDLPDPTAQWLSSGGGVLVCGPIVDCNTEFGHHPAEGGHDHYRRAE